MIDVLFSRGADLTVMYDPINFHFRATPLIWAAFYGRKTAIKRLVEAGADLFVEDGDGYNALHCALLYMRIDAVLLQTLGAKYDHKSLSFLSQSIGNMYVQDTVVADKFVGLFDSLCKDFDVNWAVGGKPPLLWLVESIVPKCSRALPTEFDKMVVAHCLETLLKAEANVNADYELYSILHLMVARCALFLNNVASSEAPDQAAALATLMATVRPLFRRLADAGLKITRNLDGFTPLGYLKHKVTGIEMDQALLNPVIVELVAAGDRAWEYVPVPCPGIGAAISSVWKSAEPELRHLFYRLSAVDKNRCQETLRVLHRHLGGEKDLQMRILSMSLAED